VFNSRQPVFNSRQPVFNSRQPAFNSRQPVSIPGQTVFTIRGRPCSMRTLGVRARPVPRFRVGRRIAPIQAQPRRASSPGTMGTAPCRLQRAGCSRTNWRASTPQQDSSNGPLPPRPASRSAASTVHMCASSAGERSTDVSAGAAGTVVARFRKRLVPPPPAPSSCTSGRSTCSTWLAAARPAIPRQCFACTSQRYTAGDGEPCVPS
jgi:hypothetical protein